MKKTLLLVFICFSTQLVHSQILSYSDGYSFGETDAQETYDLFFEQRNCVSEFDSDWNGTGSQISYETCWICPNESGFVNFWQGYILNSERNYCNNRNSAKSEYYRGIVNGYKDNMLKLSIKYNGNYFGGPGRSFVICP